MPLTTNSNAKTQKYSLNAYFAANNVYFCAKLFAKHLLLSMHLCLDLGNTRAKIALFHKDGHIASVQHASNPLSIDNIRHIVQQYSVSHSILSSVAQPDPSLHDYLDQYTQFIELSHLTPIPIQNHYATPQTLGKDRLAGVIAGNRFAPFSDILVIDAGSCITYDFIDAQANYWGGSIVPGINMRCKAMHAFTGRLPLISLPQHQAPPHTANTTITAMQSGIFWGILAETDGIINHYKSISPQIKVLFTGGDTDFFVQHLRNTIIPKPNLILEGLHQILLYNISIN